MPRLHALRWFVPWSFAALLPAQHPQAATDCANCHLGAPGAQLEAIHGFNCFTCHTDHEFDRTLLGPLGNWNHQCSACHAPAVLETGNLPVPGKGHRCAVCHGQQLPIGDARELHQAHAERANCVACHAFVPDLGTTVGSGNRAICLRCHDTSVLTTSLTDLHRTMTTHRLDCLECHATGRPAVDVVPGPRVGNATTVCDICHVGQDPAVFASRGVELHRRHVDQRLDCGGCHADAQPHDDREPMPPFDDVRRSAWTRGAQVCSHCHATAPSASATAVHRLHVGDQRMWCYDCHDGQDLRPLGQSPPVQRPADSCRLCHTSRTFVADFPYAVHEQHAGMSSCYVCHQGTPPLRDWPRRWRTAPGTFANYGSGCAGSTGTPHLDHVGLPLLGRSFQVTLAHAPANGAALLAFGWVAMRLRLDDVGMPGCALLVQDPVTVLAIADGSGAASTTWRLPGERTLVGEPFVLQWLVLDSAANALGLTASDGGRATIGR